MHAPYRPMGNLKKEKKRGILTVVYVYFVLALACPLYLQYTVAEDKRRRKISATLFLKFLN